MTDTHAQPAAPDPAVPAQERNQADPAEQAKPLADPNPADSVDYRALYEQVQAKLTKAEQAAKEHKKKAAKLDEIEAAQQTEGEKATRRAETAETQLAALRRRAVDAEIRASASGWADPTDAPHFLDDRDKYVSDGEIDTVAIAADLAAVLLARPHLAATGEQAGQRRPKPDPLQGQRQSGPAGWHAEVASAELRADWKSSIALKNQRLAEQAATQRH